MDSFDKTSVIPINQHRIPCWSPSEKPRERIFSEGAQSLSDAELLAVILRHGTAKHDVLSLSRHLLAQFGGFRGLLSSEGVRLKRVSGIGSAKAAGIAAVAEISRRYLKEQTRGKDIVRDPQAVVDYLFLDLRDKKKEIFKVLFLNKQNSILEERNMFFGTIDEAAVHPREIVKAILECHATAVILVHNHPSGKAFPSQDDKHITRRIASACLTINVKVLDHLIIGNNEYYSFREHGLID